MVLVDLRLTRLAKILVDYSVDLKKGEHILIEVTGDGKTLAKEVIKQVYRKQGIPFLTLKDYSLLRELLKECSVQQIKSMASYELKRMKEMDVYIGIRGAQNISELGDVPAEKMKIYMEHFTKPVHSEERVSNTKWCVLRFPNHSMAQLANMSTEAFEDFYFKVCSFDYSMMSRAMDPLVELMEKTNMVHIKGKGTDITFSIKDVPVIKCDGRFNIPDGEVFTAPVRDSVNGYVTFNTPAVYQGVTYENIRLEFKDGKVIDARANEEEKLNQVLDTDEGSRFLGEFALGLHPLIKKPMKDTLFDEKIFGSFHLTPGSCYDDAPNGNKSAIHWDLVCIQTPEYGGGEIYFDGVLVRKDGLFVVDELKGLNPENLF